MGAEETLPKEHGTEYARIVPKFSFKYLLIPYRGEYPLESTILRWRSIKTKLEKTMDTVRTFRKLIDFDIEGSGWRMLTMLAFAHDPRFDKKGRGDTDLLSWVLQLFMSDVGVNYASQECKMLLLIMLNWEEAFDCFFQNGPTRNVEAVGPPEEYTLLQHAIAAGCDYSAILKHSPNLHAVRVDPEFSRHPETPTSLAMYSAHAFQRWRRALESMHVSVEDFIHEELEHSCLVDAGWTEDTLCQAFQYNVDSSVEWVQDRDDFCPIRGCVGKCGASHWNFAGIGVQPYWMLILDLIKSCVRATDLDLLENGSPTDAELRTRRNLSDEPNEPHII